MNKERKISHKLYRSALFLLAIILLASYGCRHESENSSSIDDPQTYDIYFCRFSVGKYPDLSLNWMSFPERLNKEADILAMESTLQFTSPNRIYEQTIADLIAIRSQFSDLPIVESHVLPCKDPMMLLALLDDQAILSFRTGNYTAWDEINNQYGVYEASEIGLSGLIRLQFQRRYYMTTLREIYDQAEIPGVAGVIPSTNSGGSQDVCLEHLELDNNRVYIFSQGEGDCFAGCTKFSYSGFQINEYGNIWHLGDYSTESDSAEPNWFSQRQYCRAFLY